jgi:hypothetical protein
MVVPQSFLKAPLIRPVRHLLTAGQNLIRHDGPRDREQRKYRDDSQGFHEGIVIPDCG